MEQESRHGRRYLSRLRGCDGQGLVEYAFILLLVTIVVFALLQVLGDRLNSDFYEPLNSSVSNAGR